LEQFVFINEFEMTIFFKGKQAILMWRTTKWSPQFSPCITIRINLGINRWIEELTRTWTVTLRVAKVATMRGGIWHLRAPWDRFPGRIHRLLQSRARIREAVARSPGLYHLWFLHAQNVTKGIIYLIT
jgi:hypothetical protein